MMRFVDIMYSMPFMFFVIILMVIFGRNIFLIFVALGAVEWLTMARIVRGQALNVKNKEFIERFLEEEKKLSTQQKSQMNEVLHKQISKEPVACDGCHNESDPYIPFAELGYPPRRVDELTTSSVVGMIEKYKEFFIPNFVSPGGEGI